MNYGEETIDYPEMINPTDIGLRTKGSRQMIKGGNEKGQSHF